jgi:hypothetical protein
MNQETRHGSSQRCFSGAGKTPKILAGTLFLLVCLAVACQGDVKMMTSTNTKVTVPHNVSTAQPQNTPAGKKALKTNSLKNSSPGETASFSLDDLFWVIQLGQNPEEIRSLLGNPNDVASEGESTIYWDYPDEKSKVMLRIRFRAGQVVAVHLYEGKYHLADLIEKLGPPPLVYEADLTEERLGYYSRVFFVYPEQGIYAYVDHLDPTPEDKLDLLYQQPPEELTSCIEKAQSAKGIRVIAWPNNRLSPDSKNNEGNP